MSLSDTSREPTDKEKKESNQETNRKNKNKNNNTVDSDAVSKKTQDHPFDELTANRRGEDRDTKGGQLSSRYSSGSSDRSLGHDTRQNKGKSVV